jgi:hypothetical protein
MVSKISLVINVIPVKIGQLYEIISQNCTQIYLLCILDITEDNRRLIHYWFSPTIINQEINQESKLHINNKQMISEAYP